MKIGEHQKTAGLLDFCGGGISGEFVWNDQNESIEKQNESNIREGEPEDFEEARFCGKHSGAKFNAKRICRSSFYRLDGVSEACDLKWRELHGAMIYCL